MAQQRNKSFKGKSRGNKPPHLGKGERDSKFEKELNEDRRGKMPSRSNDPEWYTQTPELLRDAASLPFSHAAGTVIDRDITYQSGGQEIVRTTSHLAAVPGIMTLSLIPVIGDTGEANSPLNIASNSVYSFVRHANSGSKNYDAPNLMMYCMAIGQVYSYLNYLQRVYGTCQLYSHYNRYLPKAVTLAQGVDPDDLLSHLADFRYGVNVLIHKAASFACPANMTYFKRLAFLFSGIYSEGESIKDQLYMYIPEGFNYLSEQNTNPGWMLKYKPFRGKGTSTKYAGAYIVQDLIDYGNDLLNPLIMSEDINIMSGDILKAYGTEGILGLQSLPEDFTILPVTDLTVLEQFQNADFFPGMLSDSTNQAGVVENVDQNLIDSKITGNPDASGMPYHLAHLNEHVLTTILTNPTPADVIERTRLMTTYDTTTVGSTSTYRLLTGTEVAVLLQYCVWQDGAYRFQSVSDFVATNESSAAQTFLEALNNHCYLENFKFHPTIYYYHVFADTPTSNTFYNAAVDIDNYTLISDDTLRNMNQAALLSLLRVPSIAKF